MKSLGLDLSLTNTGYCVVSGASYDLNNIKSKPDGKRPIDEIKRLQGIVEKVEYLLSDIYPDVVVVEGLAFMARNTTALVQLAGLNYMVRDLLVKYNIPFIIVAPTTLKKFITGKGNAPKDTIMLEIFKRYNITILDNNTADAFALAQCGQAYLGTHKPKLTAPQKEVVELLKQQ